MKEKLTSLWQRLFGDSVRAFGVVSFIFLVSLAVAPAKNYFSEWRHYQHGYLRMIRNRSDAVHAAAPLSGRHSADLAARSRRR